MQNIPAVIFNLAIFVLCAGAIHGHLKKNPLKIVLRYFTALSNIFCAGAALAETIARIYGSIPQAVYILKYAGTCAVTVTLLTVMLFLGPTKGYKPLLSGPDLMLHLICPLLAILSFLVWDRPEMKSVSFVLGILPVAAYGVLYFYKVILAAPGNRWEDFYGFNRGGKWPLSLIVMASGSIFISRVFIH